MTHWRPRGRGRHHQQGRPPDDRQSHAGKRVHPDELRRRRLRAMIESAPAADDSPALQLDRRARQLARKFASIPTSQLYQFYRSVQEIRRRLDDNPHLGRDVIAGELFYLRAAAVRAVDRHKYKVGEGDDPYPDPAELVGFLSEHATGISDADVKKSFMDFLRHFEAIMAYHYVYAERQAR
jgi:CRISPR type III-A-associated protein Csm2